MPERVSPYDPSPSSSILGINSRPNFGYIQLTTNADLNIAFSTQDGSFQRAVTQIKRLLFQILGLSQSASSYWKNPSTGLSYNLTQVLFTATVRSKSTRHLATPNALAAAQNQFGCSNITGVQLENDQYTTTTTSYLERTMFKGDVMSAGDMSEFYIVSQVTAGWLLDTGWYFNLNPNFIETLTVGLLKGCTYYTSSSPCAITPEFCQTANSTSQCSTFYESQGICQGGSLDPYLDVGCMTYVTQESTRCTTMSNAGNWYTAYGLQSYNYNAKCFVSSLIDSTSVTSRFPADGILAHSGTKCSAFGSPVQRFISGIDYAPNVRL